MRSGVVGEDTSKVDLYEFLRDDCRRVGIYIERHSRRGQLLTAGPSKPVRLTSPNYKHILNAELHLQHAIFPSVPYHERFSLLVPRTATRRRDAYA